MIKRIRNKWVADLRSGNYKQGCGALKDGDKYCCLGVLCDIHAKETGNEWEGSDDECESDLYMGNHGVPPTPVRKWSGIYVYMTSATYDEVMSSEEVDESIKQKFQVNWDNIDSIDTHDGKVSLANMNDELGLDFKEIAQMIELYCD